MEAIFEEIVCDDVHKLFKKYIDRLHNTSNSNNNKNYDIASNYCIVL